MTNKNFTVRFSVVMNSTKKEFMSNLNSEYTAECANGKAVITSPVLNGVEGIKALKAVYEDLVSKGCSLNNECFFEVSHESAELTTAIKTLQMYRKLENVLDKLVCTASNEMRIDNISFEDLDKMLDSNEITFDDLAQLVGDKDVVVSPEAITFKLSKGIVDFKKNISWLILTQRFVERASEAKFVTDNQVAAEDIRALRNVLRTIPAKGCDAYTAEAYNYLRTTARIA